MNNEERATVRFDIPVVANLILPEGNEERMEVTLFRADGILVELVQTEFSLKHQAEMIDLMRAETRREPENPKNAETIIAAMKRTFIVPTLRVHFSGC